MRCNLSLLVAREGYGFFFGMVNIVLPGFTGLADRRPCEENTITDKFSMFFLGRGKVN